MKWKWQFCIGVGDVETKEMDMEPQMCGIMYILKKPHMCIVVDLIYNIDAIQNEAKLAKICATHKINGHKLQDLFRGKKASVVVTEERKPWIHG